VRRFWAEERSLHWLLAITFLLMLATGLVLYLPAFAQLAANRRLWKSIHLGAAIAFWAGLVILLLSDTQGRLRLYARYGSGPQALADDIKLLLKS